MKKLFLVFVIVTLITSCSTKGTDDSPDPPPPVYNLPTVTITAINSITISSSSGGGTVTNDGNATITARGICWSLSSNPTTNDFNTTDGTGAGSFTSEMTSLIEDTTYFVRAYATNSEGTAYSSEVSFKTEQTSGGVFDGGAYLTSQEAVDDFGANNYDELTGGIIIKDNGSGSPIIDLSPLNSIRVMGALLTIERNEQLSSLQGLENLESVGGIEIYWNPVLSSIEGLNGLTQITSTDLVVTKNYILESLVGLEGITQVPGSLSISGKSLLQNLQGLNNLTTVGNDFTVGNTEEMIDLSGINNLISVGYRIHISGNSKLADINDLENLVEVRVIEIAYNEVLSSIEVFNNLSTTNFELIQILANPILSSLDGLNTVNKVTTLLKIRDNEALINLNGLNNLADAEQLVIHGTNLESLEGLNSLESVNNFTIENTKISSLNNLSSIMNLGSVALHYNNSLVNIDSFMNIQSLSGNLQLSFNDMLANLNGLNNIMTISGYIEVYNNLALNDLCGLRNVLSGSFSQGYSVFSNGFNPTQQDIIDGNCSN